MQGFRFFDPNFVVFQYFDLDQLDLLDDYLKISSFCVCNNINMGINNRVTLPEAGIGPLILLPGPNKFSRVVLIIVKIMVP